jgi:hypothetical protein
MCGSTRFTEQMLVKQWELTKQGHVVLTWCALPNSYFEKLPNFNGDYSHGGDLEGVREIVDEVHKRKIDLADEVLVINIGGYIGKSTRSEIDYARAHGKPVKYLECQPEEECGHSWIGVDKAILHCRIGVGHKGRHDYH